jgi:ABC-type branched-subunit amino acid transport system permease subunit
MAITVGRQAFDIPERPRSSADSIDEPFAALRRARRVKPSNLVILTVGVLVGLFSNSFWLFIWQMSFVLGIMSVGTLVVTGYARETTLMQGALTGSGIYISGWAYRDNTGGLNLPFPVAVAMGTGFVVAISFAVALVSARLSPIYIMILTLTVQYTIENSVFISEKLTGGLDAPIVARPNFFGVSLKNEHYMYFFLFAITVAVVVMMEEFRHSKFGRAMIAVGNDRQAAAAMGINPWRYRVVAFTMGGMFAGLGGALWAPQLGAPPGPDQFMAMESLFFLAIPVLAGFESIVGVVIIGMVFMALPMALAQWNLDFQPSLLGGGALFVGVLAGPRGIHGFFSDRIVKARQRLGAEGLRGLRPRMPSLTGLRRRGGREAARQYRVLRADPTADLLWDRIAESGRVGD